MWDVIVIDAAITIALLVALYCFITIPGPKERAARTELKKQHPTWYK